ncbi:DUF1559 domain-containing protein [Fimbriiglobus ruber]|uniref:Uncharacterized protein n=2 Tax=Fimbriiglobus ruber TaxID=1908690 RepID=A0A225D5T3_9BACT|nr:DUF1559 domain-containing protein [Fimbriiglobus ruber]OWK36333.1 hypothetical protein FRUB_08896 [Fimbriiglobus ruber]
MPDDDFDRPRRRPRSDDDDDRPRQRPDDDDDRWDDRPRRPQTNGVATAALVLGVLSLCGAVTAVPAIICGGIGLSRANSRGGSGMGMAIAGLILGVFGLIAVPIMIGLLLPAVQKVRDAAARAKSSNNLKQIALGVHSYHDANNHLPTPYVQPPGDRPAPADPTKRLSWRVSVLPYIEEGSLYNAMKLGEAWDGPTNGPLTQRTVMAFSDPGRLPTQPNNQTPYRAFVGGGALFDEDKPAKKIFEIPDGTSNTILMVEAAQTVPWAQYNELPFDPNGPLPPFGAPQRDTFLVGMADGSVRTVKKSVSPQVLKGAITANGGERLPLDW